MSGLSIQQEPPDSEDAKTLVDELDAFLNPLYAPENRHGLSHAALQDTSVTFLVARWDSTAIGCAAIKFFPEGYSEVKRMFVRPAWRGRGVAKALLQHLEQLSIQHGFTVLRLETGIHPSAAASLYESVGFSRCQPFGSYKDDGVSLCYEKLLTSTNKEIDS